MVKRVRTPRDRKQAVSMKPDNIAGDPVLQQGSNSKSIDHIDDWASLRHYIVRKTTRGPLSASAYIHSLQWALRRIVFQTVGGDDESCQPARRDISPEGRGLAKNEAKSTEGLVKVEEESVGAPSIVQMKRGRGRPRKDASIVDGGGSNSITNYLVKGQRPPSLESTRDFQDSSVDPLHQ